MDDFVLITYDAILEFIDSRIERTNCKNFEERNKEAKYIKSKILELKEIYKNR